MNHVYHEEKNAWAKFSFASGLTSRSERIYLMDRIAPPGCYNEKALKAYLRNGFAIVETVDNPIGNGFFMNDYVMEVEL